MRKYIALIVAAVLIMGLCISASANVSVQLVTERVRYGNPETRSPIAVGDTNVVAHYFETEGVLRTYEVYCPSMSNNIGGMTVNIYVWQGSYEDTVANEPIATSTPMDFADNALVKVPVYEFVNASRYLAVFSDPVETVGVWKCSASAEGKVNKVYINGELSAETALDSYITTSENVFVSEIERDVRSAYSGISAADYDKKSSGLEITNQLLDVKTWRSVAAFADVDFGSAAPRGIEARIYNYACSDHGEMQVWLDNPVTGTKIAEVYYEYRFLDRVWETLTDEITQSVTGVHDVYLTFSIAGIQVESFKFLSAAPEASFDKIRLSEFTAVEDSSLVYNYSDTWSATDMMGRKLPGFETVGERDEDREVHLFYHSWHAWQETMDNQGVNNNQATIKKYLRNNPGGTEADIKNAFNYPDGSLIWGSGMKYWNESIYGYYSTLDEWVVRKQLELLSAAGVDAIAYDNTNGTTTWAGGYMTIGRVMHQMHLDGIQTPNMVFWLRFGSGWESNESMRKLYQYMYSTGLYSDCWHYYEGKPLIRAYPDYLLTEDTLHPDINALNLEIYDFFTFRPIQASYFTGQTLDNQWPWLEVYPQHGFNPLEGSKYDYEMVSVGTAQNANDSGLTGMNGEGVYGRSYTYANRFAQLSDESKFYGYNFQEQWDRAFELNPKMVFITGWNEFTMAHEKDRYGITGWVFGDNYNDEYSRDIEPTKGDFKDNYYYQMAANIRRFKGVSKTPVANEEKSIRLGEAFSQWDAVEPAFYGYAGGTAKRYSMIKGNNGYYTNTTGRNDIVLSKVARDSDYLYFYVKTSENITEHTDESWMRLFINTDRTYKTGWEGYDFAVNIDKPSTATSAYVSYSADGWNWKQVGNISYKRTGNQMMMRIPREMIGLEDKIVDIEFKWIDNMQNQGDIMDVYNNGDSAPIGRFAYRYTETTDYDTTPVDEPVTVSELKTNQHKHSVIMAVDSTVAFAGGKQLTLDVAPQLINEKTMIPLRFFSESFGAEVRWNDKTRTATVKMDGNTVEITVGKSTMLANGEAVALESPAVIQNGRILIPMRDLSENLGKQVLWVDGGLVIAGENPETVRSYEWVGDMTEDHYGIR